MPKTLLRKGFAPVRALVLLALTLGVLSMVTADFAEARRGGSFGSRGFRTFDRPAPTRTAPNEAAPVQRSMTPRQQTQQGQPAAQRGQAQAAQNRGLFGGMAGGLIGGLMLGGLIGLLLGNGLGGLAGFFGLLLQVGLIVVAFLLIRRLIMGNRQPAYAGGPAMGPSEFRMADAPPRTGAPSVGLGGSQQADTSGAMSYPEIASDEIGITAGDLDRFEQLLTEVQAAFAQEDYARLRALCTPEIVSYLSEELSQNAVNGQRNDVSDVRLLQGDLSEAWREEDKEYATVAMRYESVDVMRDRQTGAIIGGAEEPTETTELWTFVRPVGGEWQLSAIQDA